MNANGKCTAGGRQPGKSFFRGGKNQSISPYKVICPVSQKTGQPPLVVRFLMVWVYSYGIWNMEYITYQPVPFPFYWQQTTARCSLPTARCSLLIAHCTLPIVHPPPKEIPRRRPPGIPYLQYHMHLRGPAPGKVSPGEAWRDRPLLKRRVSPRSSSLAKLLPRGPCAGEGLGGGGPRGVCLS